MIGFSHNTKIASSDKEVKLLTNVKFEPEGFIEEKIGNSTAKF